MILACRCLDAENVAIDNRAVVKSSRICCGALLLTALLLSGCYIRASPPIAPEKAESCPDLSGDYFFPGGKRAEGVCKVLDSPHHPQGAAFRWPHPEGGFAELRSPSIIRLDQIGCESLQLEILYRAAQGVISKTSARDLVRRHERKEVEWTEDSLRYSDRIRPKKSFTLAPVNAARETFFLQLLDDSLVYKASYWEATEGERELTECRLPVATDQHWKDAEVLERRGSLRHRLQEADRTGRGSG